MQDIRKPYNRSRSSRDDLSSRVMQFESRAYKDEQVQLEVEEEPVRIPTKTFRERRNINNMDMYPRRERRETEENEDDERNEIVYRDPRTKYRNRQNSMGTWAFIITVVVIALGAWLFTYVFNSATITIVPKYQEVDNFRKTITLKLGLPEENSISFIVATTTIIKNKTLALTETKKVESKASGKIVVYNNFDTEPQKLIKNTRFESSNGKIYRINQSIVVPGKKGNTPGSIEVTVYADAYGAEYNIPPSDFSLPALKGTPSFTLFFGRSNGLITGGASGNTALASLSDINAAKDELALETAQEIKTQLGLTNTLGYIGLNSAIDIMYEDNEDEVLRGTTSVYEVTATGYLMLVPEAELAKIIAVSSVRGYNNEGVRLSYLDTMSYTRKDSDRIVSSEKLDLLVEGNPRVIWTTDEEKLKTMVVGKARDEFKPLMSTVASIKGAEIGFSPLWLSRFPAEVSKIKVVETLPKR